MSRFGRTFKGGRSSMPPFFSQTSFWSRRLGPNRALAADQSPGKILANMINYGNSNYSYDGTTAPKFYGYSGVGYGSNNWPSGIFFNFQEFSNPVYFVRSRTQPQYVNMQYVILYENWNNDRPFGNTNYPGLQTKCANVPLPKKELCPQITGVEPFVNIWSGPQGGDMSLVIVDLDTDEMWEFEQLANSVPANAQVQNPSATWSADAAGYTASASTFPGVFPNNSQGVWGISASRLGVAGGLITMQDLRDVNAGGTINHAISIASEYNISGVSVANQIPPAKAGDGSSANGVSVIPANFPNAGQPNPAKGEASKEAWGFCFPPNVDLSGCKHPLSQALGQAIRDYGMYLRDTTGGEIAVYMEDPRTLGSPYHMQGPNAIDPWKLTWPGHDPRWGGTPVGGWSSSSGWTVLNELPWNQLQTLAPFTA